MPFLERRSGKLFNSDSPSVKPHGYFKQRSGVIYLPTLFTVSVETEAPVMVSKKLFLFLGETIKNLVRWDPAQGIIYCTVSNIWEI